MTNIKVIVEKHTDGYVAYPLELKVEIDRKLVFAHSLVPERHRLPLFLLGYLS